MTGGTLPRLLLAAPGSGGGKTTMTCAILQALVNRGLAPAAFKCGPDYIDPMFHSRMLGVKSRNLDLFFMDANRNRQLLYETAKTCDLALIEGVMGYYDGVGMTEEASAYALARATDTPAVLVVDGGGRALSAAALILGFRDFRPESGLRGVIFTRISPMLYPRLKACVEAETGLRVYGFLPELAACALESRHLGLITADEVENLGEKLALLAEQAEKTLDLDGLLALASTAPPLDYAPLALPLGAAGHPKIALARDEAFCFYYADGLQTLEQLGAELVDFSPLRDRALPPNCSGLYLGGGYPELHARALAENAPMRASILAAVKAGMPTVAECGGFLYLHESLEDPEGEALPMVGAIKAKATKGTKLGNFGYITLSAQADNLLCQKGETLSGHEFHYWQSDCPGEAFAAQKPRSDRSWTCGWAGPSLYAGFPHFHFSACPQAAARFVRAAEAFGEVAL
ncbi:MAG: cobyrinate a,c-diamide synthase [Pseudoflavonifractor sp.]